MGGYYGCTNLRERHVEQEQPARTTSQFNAVPAIVRRCRLLDLYVTADRNPGGIRQGMLEEIYVAISVPVKFQIHAPPDSWFDLLQIPNLLIVSPYG